MKSFLLNAALYVSCSMVSLAFGYYGACMFGELCVAVSKALEAL